MPQLITYDCLAFKLGKHGHSILTRESGLYAQEEIVQVAVAEGRAFDDFDFVVDAFQTIGRIAESPGVKNAIFPAFEHHCIAFGGFEVVRSDNFQQQLSDVLQPRPRFRNGFLAPQVMQGFGNGVNDSQQSVVFPHGIQHL